MFSLGQHPALEDQDVTHRRVWRRKLWGSRQAPALEAVARVQKGARSRSPRASARHRQLLRSDAQTAAAKRARHQNVVRRGVRHLHRLKPAEHGGGGKGTNAGLQRRRTEGPWSRSGTTVHLGVGGSGPKTHHGRNEAGRGTGAALGSHGRVAQAVDRGEVRDGQTLPSRQHFPATAVQGHSRRGVAASALCGGEGAGSVTSRKKARTGTSKRHWRENFKTGWRLRTCWNRRIFWRRRERTRDRRHGKLCW